MSLPFGLLDLRLELLTDFQNFTVDNIVARFDCFFELFVDFLEFHASSIEFLLLVDLVVNFLLQLCVVKEREKAVTKLLEREHARFSPA